jgi:hypothetical protein
MPRISTVLALSLLGLGALMAGPSRASNTSLNGGATIEIWGTGRTSTNSGPKGTTDVVNNNPISGALSILEETWKLIAFPNDYVTTDLTFPGNLYIPNRVPAGWAGQTGGDNTPVNGYRWITYANWAGNGTSYGTPPASPNNAYATSYFRASNGGTVDFTGMNSGFIPANGTGANADYYSYIAQTSFIAPKTGTYTSSTNIAADNFIEVYLNGSVQYNNLNRQPTITGGTLLTQLATNNGAGLFGSVVTRSGVARVDLVQGQTYDLNYVIRDNCTDLGGTCNYGQTGFLVGTTAFTEVPGPLPVLGLAGFLHHARRLRRRLEKKVF